MTEEGSLGGSGGHAPKLRSSIEWTCARCGTVQEPRDGVCRVCGASHPELESTEPAQVPERELLVTSPDPPLQGRARVELIAEVVVVVLVGWSYSWFHSIAVHIWPEARASPTPFWLRYEILLFGDIPLIALLLYLIWRSGEPWSKSGLVRPRPVLDTLAGGAFWIIDYAGFVFLCAFVYPVLERFFPYDDGDWIRVFSRPSGAIEWFFCGMTILVCAFFEELSMRGYLIPRLERILRSPGEAILLSAIIFAGGHAYQGLYGVLGATQTGLLYGVAFVITGRLWPLVLAHAIHNVHVLLSRLP